MMLSLLFACATDGDTSAAGVDLSLSLNEAVGSVVKLEVTSPEPTTLVVTYGVGEERNRSLTVTVPATEHQLNLYGLPYGYEVGVTVESTTAGGEAASGTANITTDGLPSDFPGFAVGGEIRAWKDGYAVLNTAGSANYAFILDGEGRVVWAWKVELPSDEALMRALVGDDGETVYLVIAGRSEEKGPLSRVLKVPLHGGSEEAWDWPWLDHDIVDLGDGALAGIQRVAVDGLQGDAVVERDADGNFRTLYSTWDDPQLGEPQSNSAENSWTHMESLDWDAETGLLSFQTYLTHQFVRFGRDDGVPVLHLYGEGSDYAPAEGVTPLHVAHQFQVLSPTRFLHFENGSRERSASRAVEFELDETDMTYREVWSHTSDPPLYVSIKGDVTRFDDGSTQVLWATAGRIEDVNPAGTVDWWLQLDLGAVLTYVQHVDGLGAH
jgi:hypothetical protein